MEIDESILNEWYDAVRYSGDHLSSRKIDDFKEKYPLEYGYISRFFRLRTELKNDIECLLTLGPVQWFTLTYSNEYDSNLEETKRKSAFSFLNRVFSAFLLVEEYGEDNGRYHIHGFGVYWPSKGFDDFREWTSAQNISTLDEKSARKKVKYLTKYAVKQLPRLRRSKTLCLYKKAWNTAKRLKTGFKACYQCRCALARYRLLWRDVLN